MPSSVQLASASGDVEATDEAAMLRNDIVEREPIADWAAAASRCWATRRTR